MTGHRKFPRLLVLSTAAILFAAGVASVLLWGRNIGLAEDWYMVPAMTGHQEDLLGWLWSQNNEHRLPVQRLLYLIVLKITGDFRAGMLLNQLLLLSMAMAMTWAAVRARGGGYHWSDILYPLALLHLGHWSHMVWGWNIHFVWSAFLIGLLLSVVMATGEGLTRRTGWIVALVFPMLPISGANGLAVTLALAPWVALQGVVMLRQDGAGGRAPGPGRALLVSATVAVALIAVYFIGYVHPSWSPPAANWEQFVIAARSYFAFALGPWTKWHTLPAAAIVLLILVSGLALCLRAFRSGNPAERLRSGTLALFIACGLALGVAIAFARGAYPYRMPDRYALFSVQPLLVAAYAWQLYAPPAAGRVLLNGLALLFLVMLPLNVKSGTEWRDWYDAGMRRVEADIEAAVPIPEIAERHYEFLLHWSQELLERGIHLLDQAGIGPFAGLPAGPAGPAGPTAAPAAPARSPDAPSRPPVTSDP